MTGTAFLRLLLEEWRGRDQESLVRWLRRTKRQKLLALIRKADGQLNGAFKPMSEAEIMAFVMRNDSLVPLLPDDGIGAQRDWSKVVPCLPAFLRRPVSASNLAECLRLWVWFVSTAELNILRVSLNGSGQKKSASVKRVSPARGRSASRSASRQSRRYGNEDRSLDLYLREIGETPLLSPQEEIALAKRIREGDQDALERLVKANLRFVVSVAKHYQNQGLSLADLINEGNIGLVKAAKRFNETRGFKFISYAVWWIRQAIMQALAEQSRIVRLPLNRVGTLHRIGKAVSSLGQELGREPTSWEIASELELLEAEVSSTMKISSTHLSLDAPFSNSDDNSLIDVLEDEHTPAPDELLFRDSLNSEIERALGTLTPREAEVINLYFGLDHEESLTLEEIGVRFRLTRERVRQIKEKAIRRLRHAQRRRRLAQAAATAGVEGLAIKDSDLLPPAVPIPASLKI